MTTASSLDPIAFRANHDSTYGLARWNSSAPRTVREAGQWGNDSPGWIAWQKHLAKRRKPRAAQRLLCGLELHPSAGANADGGATQTWADEPWETSTSDQRAELTVEFARSLAAAAATMPADRWWQALGRLLELSQSASSAPNVESPSAWQLLACELPLTLGYEFPELEACRALAPRAIERLNTAIDELLDGDGLPHARFLPQFRELLAGWTRMRILSDALGDRPWPDELIEQFDRAVVHALRLMRRDGSQALGPASVADAVSCEWLMEAAKATGRRATIRLAKALLGGKAKNSKQSKRIGPSADHSEWAELGVLRTDWTRDAARLTVAYADRRLRCELASGKETLFSGDVTIALRHNDRPATIESDWEEVCWETNDECDYLELEATFSGGIRIQRHLMLARNDAIAFMADAILCTEPTDLLYAATVPLADGVAFETAYDSNEAQLETRKPRALVLPLSLPEWRSATRNGSLSGDSNTIRLHHSAPQVRGLYAPIFFDLKPRRFANQFTWRRLTVAEERSVVPADVAVGYRVHIDNRQWLVYRSLEAGRSRTLLGHHLLSEFLIGRFTDEGMVDPLIEIE